jgi:hypothetical protein
MSKDLSQYFSGVALKTLSAVEVDRSRSHQHEFQATTAMREFLGNPDDALQFDATFLYLSDDEADNKAETAQLTLYNARRNKPNRSPEYRLYFRSNDSTDSARSGDLLAICLMENGGVLVLIAEHNSLVEYQVCRLFGQATLNISTRFDVSNRHQLSDVNVSLPEKLILESIGVLSEQGDETLISTQLVLDTFEEIPSGRVLSEFARIQAGFDPSEVSIDEALIKWLEIEYETFQTLEKRDIQRRLQQGFIEEGIINVESFLHYSSSVNNRRKSRAGKSLEYHLEYIFQTQNIVFSSQKFTEGQSKPDFIFPGIAQYSEPGFPISELTFLGAKRTLKDRWRQILKEADRIPTKHLVTVDTALTETQIEEINNAGVKLVVPSPIAGIYPASTAESFLDLSSFLEIVKDRQAKWM